MPELVVRGSSCFAEECPVLAVPEQCLRVEVGPPCRGFGHLRLLRATGDGRYRVRLSFVEPSRLPDGWVFDVAADGALVLRGIGIAKALDALKRTFDATVTSGCRQLRW